MAGRHDAGDVQRGDRVTRGPGTRNRSNGTVDDEPDGPHVDQPLDDASRDVVGYTHAERPEPQAIGHDLPG